MARSVLLAATIACVSLASACCQKHSAAPTTAPAADHVVIGKVVDQPPPAGQVSIERWRFQPDGSPSTYLRLTRIHAQEATTPESQEIQLDHWAGKKIKVKYQIVDQTWVWGAEVIETIER